MAEISHRHQSVRLHRSRSSHLHQNQKGLSQKSPKRTGQIPNDEKFYNHDLILSEIEPKFKNIWSDLKNEIVDLKQLTIFGELIGGDYPHKEVEIYRKAIMVQKGIFYSPKNHFYAFDILIQDVIN